MVFDARVIGVPDYVELVREVRGRDAAGMLNEKLSAARDALSGKLDDDRRKVVLEFFRHRGQPVCHISFERYGFLQPLEEWAAKRCESKGGGCFTALFPHLAALGASDGMIIPVEFETPVMATIKGRPRPYPVCSAHHLLAELEAANAVLRVEHAFRFPKVPDFVRASSVNLADMERAEGLDEAFWAKFGLVVLRHLVRRSIDANLPIIFAERAVVPLAS